MSVVMALAAGVLVGLAILLQGTRPGHRFRQRRTSCPGRHWSLTRRPKRHPGSGAQVRFTRQLAALLRSGSSLDAAFATLETIWSQSIPAAAIPPSSRPTMPRPADPAATDIAAACRLARTSRTLGRSAPDGLRSHAAGNGLYAGYWWRLAWCVALTERSGAALATVLEHLAAELEAAADRERALDVALAGPRSTRRLLGWLPVAGLGLAQLAGANPVGVLLTTTPGRLALAAGGALWLINGIWSARLLAAAREMGTE